ncbi:WD-40 repeat-containing protein [Gloeophyllum trabeum ATCC 11539]|uniref:ASTRA-associated protein 1 n=1 Tax=Gloeophyllum trabeum (strain ATCC 11539 / FP-39264 / Madison 617) TaxID=670483 RepID=S7PZB3_GLOTA|nr:WD-40 repeat-containing protein [Gloeophyllum trabeum ATCC 11539]EPQ52637.1 WD-40 repeat-containing protein [Gloeophyllum trabeum ATCC 11539]
MRPDKQVTPNPSHRLRSHASPVHVACFSEDNKRIYTGDGSGWVMITSTRTLRALASWKAHADSLLGIQEWEDSIITHARDNKLYVWKSLHEARMALGGSAALPGLQTPSLLYAMDVNALNYCRFSLCPLPPPRRTGEISALLAVPNLIESSLADVWTLPSPQRLHAAIGKTEWFSTPAADGHGGSKSGIIMSMHLFLTDTGELRILLGYENGAVTMWRYSRTDNETSVEGVGWESIWSHKLHLESVMAMAVTPDNSVALTVSADHIIGRYDLRTPEVAIQNACVAHKTKSIGHSTIAIRDDGRICAVGGWDGKIRLYSTKTLKPLGTLTLHKNACQALAFARYTARPAEKHATPTGSEDALGEDDDMTEEEREERTRWLVSGGRDCRVAIWPLMSFAKT